MRIYTDAAMYRVVIVHANHIQSGDGAVRSHLSLRPLSSLVRRQAAQSNQRACRSSEARPLRSAVQGGLRCNAPDHTSSEVNTQLECGIINTG